MKCFAKPLAGLIMGAALSLPAVAQQSFDQAPLPGETALEYATRVDACDGAVVQDAEFIANQTRIRVSCPRSAAADTADGMTGGLGGGAVAIVGGLLVAVFALSGGSSGSTPSTN
ncbi:hypothetical protein DQW77_17240 [Roseovarius sp. TE539]|uniref:hypothetical protein n=1 Tax=Roseovarius sp. TE539 TaxID=2249812 RepID=UPI000DDF7610|nr:hypothetical protein [Roseovarius sp. TE539]RBI67861.1 hypothetical protein DQW77_17240 [Roseovarius sp. TE539]